MCFSSFFCSLFACYLHCATCINIFLLHHILYFDFNNTVIIIIKIDDPADLRGVAGGSRLKHEVFMVLRTMTR